MNVQGNFQVGAYGVGVMEISGTGTVNHTAATYPVIGRFVGGVGVLTVSGGTYNHSNAGSFVIVAEKDRHAECHRRLLHGFATAAFGPYLTTGAATGFVNLNGGTISTPLVDKGTGSATSLSAAAASRRPRPAPPSYKA